MHAPLLLSIPLVEIQGVVFQKGLVFAMPLTPLQSSFISQS
jgi:hypothetical protein